MNIRDRENTPGTGNIQMRRVIRLGKVLLSVTMFFQLIVGPMDTMDKVYYDVVVIGGDPEGVAASVASARNGASTILIEERDGLGGLLTYGMLNQLDLGRDKDKRIANQGVFTEWHQMVGNTGTFDIEQGKDAFLSLVEAEENLALSLNTHVIDIMKTGNKVTGVTVETEDGQVLIRAKQFIDATADAKFAAEAGVPYFVGQEDLGLKDVKMAVTLVMVFKDVDWQGVKRAAKQGVFGGGGAFGTTAWGFPGVKQAYKPHESNTQLRGLNIGKQKDGTVTINALQIFGIDGLSEESKQKAMEKGKRETEHILEFLRAHFPGFEHAKIAKYPSELYIRETRHILAEYQLPITDVWENKDHWDSIGLGAYPVDVQQTSVNGWGYYVTNPVQYAIPFRSLVPLEVDNLLVASKAAGYSSLAAGSARTVPIGMTTGQAAGTAAAMAVAKGADVREMSKDKALVAQLQETLIAQGALLYPFELDYPYKGEWFYPSIKKLLPLGLIQAGYDNNLRPEDTMAKRDYLKLLSGILLRGFPEEYLKVQKRVNVWGLAMATDYNVPLTRDEAANVLLAISGYDNHLDERVDPWIAAKELGLINEAIDERVKEERKLTRAEGFYIVGHLLDVIDQKEQTRQAKEKEQQKRMQAKQEEMKEKQKKKNEEVEASETIMEYLHIQ